MTFYAVPTTNDDFDHTCADLIRRAAYVDNPGLVQSLAHDAIDMIRSLQAELQRAQAAGASTAVCLDLRSIRTHTQPLYDARRWPVTLL